MKFTLDSVFRHGWSIDFLSMEPEDYLGNCYDRVIMNPPFSNQQDIKHVNHALKFLKDDGVLVSVMSPGFTFRENKLSVDFKTMLEERGGYYEKNPEGSFKVFGTLVKTVIVVIPGIKKETHQKGLFD